MANSCSFNNNTSIETTLAGNWRLSDAEQIKQIAEGDDSSFEKIAGLKKIVKEGALLSLFDDGSYTQINGEEKYIAGNWKFSDRQNTLLFIDPEHSLRQIVINVQKNAKGREMLTILNSNENVALKYIKESAPLKLFANDPFYASNNLWRIKPKQSENLPQLKKRLANYFKHIALILKAANDRKQDAVSFEFSQGPIKIYNGGIGIYPFTIIPEYWKDSFFDESEAKIAYQYYEDFLKTNNYKGVSTGKWIDDDYNILLSMYADFSEPE